MQKLNKALVRIDFINGMTQEELVVKYKTSKSAIYSSIRDLAKAQRETERAKRDGEFIELYTKQAKTLKEIGDMYGITREMVRQRLQACGVDKEIGGAALRSVIKKIHTPKKLSGRESSCQMWYGCSLEFRDKYGSPNIKGTLTSAFKNQKNAARHRKIDWDLTFPEWIRIWEESGHIEERGFGSGKYVMSRICDIGSYSKDNVRIITHNENSKEARNMDKVRHPEPSNAQKIKNLADKHGINHATLLARLSKGVDLHSALTMPVKPTNRWRDGRV